MTDTLTVKKYQDFGRCDREKELVYKKHTVNGKSTTMLLWNRKNSCISAPHDRASVDMRHTQGPLQIQRYGSQLEKDGPVQVDSGVFKYLKLLFMSETGMPQGNWLADLCNKYNKVVEVALWGGGGLGNALLFSRKSWRKRLGREKSEHPLLLKWRKMELNKSNIL